MNELEVDYLMDKKITGDISSFSNHCFSGIISSILSQWIMSSAFLCFLNTAYIISWKRGKSSCSI